MKLGLLCWIAVLTSAVFATGGCLPAQEQALTVTTAQGQVHGKLIQGDTQRAFLGLPYAAPPVGKLRWRAPKPPLSWQGVHDATRFAGRCEQWHVWNDYIFLDPGPTEDCLYLNVYVPASARPSSQLPVMVWIHGGGFLAGAGSEPRYTDSGLVPKGVILVTINYRLNVFGFLASEDLVKEGGGHAGNYGFMDMVAALQWVKANISAFGGNPGNVTAFGESAGSFAVNALTAAPSAQGLFQKTIGESGAFFSSTLPLSSLTERAQRDQAWVDSLGVKDLAQLRSLSPEALIAAVQKKSGMSFSPVVDGKFLPESIPEIYAAGRQAHVPSIIGWNRDERTGTLSKEMTAAKWQAYAHEHFAGREQQFLNAFPGKTDAQAVRSADDYTTQAFIAFGAGQWAHAQATTGQSPVYTYRFDRPAPPEPNHPQGKYAFHSDELEYVFGTLDARPGAIWTQADRRLSDEIMSYWTNFARTSGPNATPLPPWPRFDKTGEILELDAPITAMPDPSRLQREFLAQEAQRPAASPPEPRP
jgi:para-nitrobenzyl esterase